MSAPQLFRFPINGDNKAESKDGEIYSYINAEFHSLPPSY